MQDMCCCSVKSGDIGTKFFLQTGKAVAAVCRELPHCLNCRCVKAVVTKAKELMDTNPKKDLHCPAGQALKVQAKSPKP